MLIMKCSNVLGVKFNEEFAVVLRRYMLCRGLDEAKAMRELIDLYVDGVTFDEMKKILRSSEIDRFGY